MGTRIHSLGLLCLNNLHNVCCFFQNYKPPGAKDIPVHFNVTFLKADKDPKSGPYGGKAVGEPPLLASCNVMNAIKMALKSARSDAGLGDEYFDMSKYWE